MIRQAFIASVCFAIAGCSPDEGHSKGNSQFVGRWAGQYSIENEGEFRYLIDRKNDGSYELQTVRLEGERVLARESESGRWFVQDGSYKVKTEKIEGKAASSRNLSNYQAYSVGEVQAAAPSWARVIADVTPQ